MKKIKLTQGQVALIDDEDFEFLSKWKWHAIKGYRNFYAARCEPRPTNKSFTVRMHSVLTGEAGSVDHIDGNGLNNQKSNLRLCTVAQNNMNSKPYMNSTSKYKGVSFDKDRNTWRAAIKKEGKDYSLRRHKTEESAARAYDKKAKELFGEFAYLNFKDE